MTDTGYIKMSASQFASSAEKRGAGFLLIMSVVGQSLPKFLLQTVPFFFELALAPNYVAKLISN
jgi:hypothetical protein